ncbi:MAG TPA: TolC family protein [Phycisphaerae bacterium]|nr:TolC family protein [Phycisphaerae bacterium]
MPHAALRSTVISGILAATLASCTVHPPGEARERALSDRAGMIYQQPIDHRQLPPLSKEATPDQLVTYALLANADVEQAYWQWRSALERVPQEGTQKSNLMLTYSGMIADGTTAASMNTLGAGSDPMNNIVLPGKLRTSAEAALENARAAGIRFDKARFELRNKVLDACDDYALTAEFIRLDRENIDLLRVIDRVTHSRLATGGTTQQDALRSADELDLAENDLAAEQAALPRELAALNALLDRAPDAPLDPPAHLPPPRAIPGDGADLLALAARNNPELHALAEDAAAKAVAVRRAKQEYWPDLSVNVTADLGGAAQLLMAAVMLPLVRYQAIDAGIRQARADLRAAEAVRRQASHDLATRVVADLSLLHDAQRQIDLFENTLLPRASDIVSATQRTYAAGQSSMLDLLDAQRSLLSLRRMLAQLKITRERQIADLEAAAGMGLTPSL